MMFNTLIHNSLTFASTSGWKIPRNRSIISVHRQRCGVLRRVLPGIVMLLCGATAGAQQWELLTERSMGFCNYAYDPALQKLYLVTWRKVLYVSDDFGVHTRRIAALPTGRPGGADFFLAAENGYFYLPSTNKGGGYFRSSDEGATWVQLTAPPIARSDSVKIRYVPELDELFTLTHRSSDHGMTWLPIKNDGARNRSVSSLVFTSNSAVWYGLDQFSKRLVCTTDNGATWTDLDTTGLATVDTPRLTVHPSDDRILFLAGDYVRSKNYLYRSSDAGATWGLVGANRMGSSSAIAGEELVFLDSVTVYLNVHDSYRSWCSLFISRDAGKTWKIINQKNRLYALWSRGRELYAWDNIAKSVLAMREGDNTWRQTGWIHATWYEMVPLDFRHLLACETTAPGFISNDRGASWESFELRDKEVPCTAPILTTHSNPPAIFTGSSRSTDGGNTWLTWDATRPYQFLGLLRAHPSKAGTVYAFMIDHATQTKRICITQDAGTTWDSTSFPLLDYFFGFAPSDPSIMFGWQTVDMWPPNHALPLPGPFYSTTDGGVTWNNAWFVPDGGVGNAMMSATAVPPGPPSATIPHVENCVSMFVSPRSSAEVYQHQWYLYDPIVDQATEYEYFRKSTTGRGGPWQSSAWGPIRDRISDMYFSPWGGDTMMVYSSPSVFVSTDAGSTWSGELRAPADLLNVQVAWMPGAVIYGSSKAGVMKSEDLGNTWQLQNAGLYGNDVDAIHLDWLGNLYALNGDGLYRWDQLLDAEGQERPVSASVELLENYPNPFQSATTVSFSLPVRMVATLRVFNMLGIEVATLADGEFAAGTKRVQWRPDRLAPGVYLLQLRAGAWTASRTMLCGR
jgi:photosystem II stability/assembly factor-like uncharacterized protein